MIELLVIGATLTIAAWASGAQAHRKSVASRALDQYAQSRGLVFAPAPSARASPQVIGSKDGVRYVVELYRLAGDMRTRLSAEAVRGRGPVLSVLQRGVFTLHEEPPLRAGHDDVDRAYVVRKGSAEDAERLREIARPLLFLDDRCTGVWLAADGSRVTVSWRGTESDPLVLDAARETAIAVAGWHRSATPYR